MRCARYQLANEGKPVPITLLPNGKNMVGANENSSNKLNPPAASAQSIPSASGSPPKKQSSPQAAGKPPLQQAKSKYVPANDPVHTSTAATFQAQAQAVAPQANIAEGMSYYLRIQINNGKNVLTELMRILEDQKIEIEALIQKDGSGGNRPASLIILIPPVSTKDMTAAIQRIRMLDAVVGTVTCIPLERLPQE